MTERINVLEQKSDHVAGTVEAYDMQLTDLRLKKNFVEKTIKSTLHIS